MNQTRKSLSRFTVPLLPEPQIRLTGIDAPERRQAFGNVSKESLAEQVAGQSVAVEWDKVDRYGRKVGKVLLGGLDSNLVQVKRGLAWHYKGSPRFQCNK